MPTVNAQNWTTLYSATAQNIYPASQYGNANVARFLDLNTDGSNVVGNINANGNIKAQNFVARANSIAIGPNAANRANNNSISIGVAAGNTNQGAGLGNAIAIGQQSGFQNQSGMAIAIGDFAGYQGQGGNSVAVGRNSGGFNQGNNSVAIGLAAGSISQANNSIILNATGTDLQQTIANTFTVKPIRSLGTTNVLFYNTTTGEITYDIPPNAIANNANFANFAGNVTNSAQPNITSVGTLVNVTVTGNITSTTGIFNGDGYGLSNINVSNIIGNSNFANFAGNVTNSAQPNITTVGNLTSLTVNDGVANASTLQFYPNANVVINTPVFGPLPYSSSKNFTAYGSESVTQTKDNTGFSFYTNDYFVSDGLGNTALTSFFSVDAYGSPPVATDAFNPAQVTFQTASPYTNLANPGTQTLTNFNFGSFSVPGFALTVGGDRGTASIMNFQGYNNTGNSVAFVITRNRGDGDNPLTVQPDDYVGDIAWRPRRPGGPTRNMRIGAKVDSSYVAGTAAIPIGFEITVCNTTANITHSFYSNGNVSFANSVTVTNNLTSNNANFGSGNILLNSNGTSYFSSSANVNANTYLYANGEINTTDRVYASNVEVKTNGFVKLASYTAAGLTAITGQVGWIAAVTDSASGGNPNGMIAFWDTTNARWSYVHDNSAV